jgi:DNA repair protein RadA/Sms
MAKPRTSFRCADCGAEHAKWAGQCSACEAWATFEETIPSSVRALPSAPVGWSGGDARPFAEITDGDTPIVPTGCVELDRALGGGLVDGSVTLLGGEPGIGKSTLLLQLAESVSARGRRVLYVSAEESAAQLRRRGDRLELGLEHVFVQAATSLSRALAEVERLAPDLLLVDSIQTVAVPGVSSVPGTVSQVRACTQALIESAKERSLATMVVGHVTKDGALAGPRTLEHLVDTVLAFEGDRYQRLRFLRAVKHRFGPTGEPGVMEMTAQGLSPVPDPSGLFLSDRQAGAAGSAIVPVLDGHRPLLVELQALVVPTKSVTPRRAAQGVDTARLAMLLAVLERRCGLRVLESEAYVSVAGGVRVSEPGADLGVIAALASSVTDFALFDDLVVCGEVGLAGEVRQVAQIDRRLEEAARIGYRRAVVPASVPDTTADIELLRAGTVSQALRLAGVAPLSAVA